MMALEREKRALLAPVHRAARRLIPALAVSRQNIEYYESLVHYYTVFDLRRMRQGQAYLYLLCYGWLRHRQLTDNILDAFTHHLRRIHEEVKAAADVARLEALKKQQLEAPRIGRVLLLYADDGIGDGTPFGAVRGKAFAILPREALLAAGQRLSDRSPGELDLRWRAFDRVSGRFRQNVRPLAMALAFSAKPTAARWLAALDWMRDVFRRSGRLAHKPAHEVPAGTMPARLRPHLLEPGGPGQPERPRGDRYEFWVYRQIVKRLGDRPSAHPARHAAGSLRQNQRFHRGAAHLSTLLIRSRPPVWRRRRPEIRFGRADDQGAPLAEIFRPGERRRSLHPAREVMSRSTRNSSAPTSTKAITSSIFAITTARISFRIRSPAAPISTLRLRTSAAGSPPASSSPTIRCCCRRCSPGTGGTGMASRQPGSPGYRPPHGGMCTSWGGICSEARVSRSTRIPSSRASLSDQIHRYNQKFRGAERAPPIRVRLTSG
jgi:hypothetical protein